MCVYDQTYVLVIVTKPKKEECAIRWDRETHFSFFIQLYKTIGAAASAKMGDETSWRGGGGQGFTGGAAVYYRKTRRERQHVKHSVRQKGIFEGRCRRIRPRRGGVAPWGGCWRWQRDGRTAGKLQHQFKGSRRDQMGPRGLRSGKLRGVSQSSWSGWSHWFSGEADSPRVEGPPWWDKTCGVPLMETEWWVETKNPHPPRRMPLRIGGPKRVAIPSIRELRSQQRNITSRRTGQRRRVEVKETGSGHARQRKTPRMSSAPGPSSTQAASMAYLLLRKQRGIRPI